MSTTTTDYELVSSFYGPGAVGCWLLIISSIFIAWTLDPIRRLKDTIDNDFLAAVTFPALAAGNTIYQAIHYPGGISELARQSVYPKEEPSPAFTAMQFYTDFNYTSFGLSFSLTFIAIWHYRVRRGLVAAGLCLLVIFPDILVTHIFTLAVMLEDPNHVLPWWSKVINLARSSTFLIFFIIGLVGYVGMLCLVGSLLLSKPRLQTQRTSSSQTQQEDSQDTSKEEWVFPPNMLRGIIVLMLGLLLFPGISFHFTWPPLEVQVSTAAAYKIPKLNLRSLVPPSGQALWELDQTAALAGGVITFAMTVYAAIKHRRDAAMVEKSSVSYEQVSINSETVRPVSHESEREGRHMRTWPGHEHRGRLGAT